MAEIILLTGDSQSGKTSFCQELVNIALEKSVHLRGLISPAEFDGDEKTGINVLDLKTGFIKRLAVLNDGKELQLQTKRWTFNPIIVEWANNILGMATPCDLLIIDEIGPLEFERNQGWTNAIPAVSRQDYRIALVVIRPSLLNQAHEIWPVSRVIDLDQTFPAPLDLFNSLDLDRGPLSNQRV